MVLSVQQLLISEFEKRRNKNPLYSLRAFARDLGISKTSLSDVINGRRRFSNQNIRILGERLGLNEQQIEALRSDVHSFSSTRDVMENDEFSLIEDWYYLAILSLAKMKGAQCSPEWISERLGLSFEVAEASLNELLKQGLVENSHGTLIRKSKPITTTADIPSTSIVEHHQQSIEKSLAALEEVEVELRDFTAVTYAFDLSKMKEAKKCILDFHRKLGKLVETDDSSEVYRHNIHLFPLSKVSIKGESHEDPNH